MDESNNIPGTPGAPEGAASQQPEVSEVPAAPGAPEAAGGAAPEAVAGASAEAASAEAAAPASGAPAAENPFAGFAVPAPEPAAQHAEPYAAPAYQPTEPAAAVPVEPYYGAAAAQPQQPAQPYGYEGYQPAGSYGQPQAGAYQQAAYQPYGAATPPPVPPAPPAQNIYPGYEPPNPNQKRRWPWFLLGLAVGIVVGMGGCAGCVGCMAVAGYDAYDSSSSYDSSDDDSYLYDDGPYSWAPEDDYELYDEDDTYGIYSLSEIERLFQDEDVSLGEPAEGDVCARGIYTVGESEQIPAGLYYLEGSNELLSHFYVFEAEKNGYKLDDGVQYFGNYYAELDEGDVIVFLPGSDASMHPAQPTSTNPTAPYNNGCYRVGIDIPAGSYTVTAYAVGEGETDEDSAAYVMKDLEFDEDSIVDTQYVIPGGKQVVTVSAGQYLELFAATATPVAQG